MPNLIAFLKKLETLHEFAATKFSSFTTSLWGFMTCSWQFISQINPFSVQLTYFTLISLAGFAALRILKPGNKSNPSKDLDLFFTSVSASTVSSMATVEMEDFSSSQLWVLTILMLIGGEVFTSMLGLHFTRAKFKTKESVDGRAHSFYVDVESTNSTGFDCKSNTGTKATVTLSELHLGDQEYVELKTNSLLAYAVTGYLLVANLGCSILIFLYLNLVSDAREVLKRKGIGLFIFSVFTAISSFGNCGFTPVNENMIIFQKNSILLLLIIPQILAGNTLFPPCLRILLWSLKKITGKEEYHYILHHPKATGYKHLISRMQCFYLILTVAGFIILQTILFCSLEWSSEALQETNSYQKIVGALFQSVNARHAGESVVDLSTLSSAILVLYTIMMYLPAYTSFEPKDDDSPVPTAENKDNRKRPLENWVLNQLSYLAIFVVLICITERNAMIMDPLNFNVFNILFEVVSAYGNVGFSVGYSCKRLLYPDAYCKNASLRVCWKMECDGETNPHHCYDIRKAQIVQYERRKSLEA